MINNPLEKYIDDDNICRLIIEKFASGLNLPVINQIKYMGNYMEFTKNIDNGINHELELSIKDYIIDTNNDFKVIKVWLNGNLNNILLQIFFCINHISIYHRLY